jgi:hypothetical protein
MKKAILQNLKTILVWLEFMEWRQHLDQVMTVTLSRFIIMFGTEPQCWKLASC